MRWFHRPSRGVMVATRTIRDDLERRGFVNVKPWSRGVDTELFRPDHAPALSLPRPVYLYVGRVAVEKNLEAFLDVPLAEGSKLVVGDGPALERLAARHPEVHFAGARHGIELARHYVSGDVFVFPSRTDTFGLVLLEALASGLPVAAYPVPGPLDVIGDSGCGVLDQDLGRAMAQALAIPARSAARLCRPILLAPLRRAVSRPSSPDRAQPARRGQLGGLRLGAASATDQRFRSESMNFPNQSP